MGKAAVIMWCRKKFFKYWRVLVPALLLAALCRPGPGPAAEAGGGVSVTVPEEPPLVALTFDDGPRTSTTSRLLDGLALREIQATFFLVGNYLETQPDLVRRMVEEGHTVGNHTYSHPDMSAIADEGSFRQELEKNEALYRELTGQEMPKLYRPPQGKFCQSNLEMAQTLGYRTVFWSLAYVDWYQDDQPTRAEAFDKLVPRVHPGAVVLLHSSSQTNAEILDELLTTWEGMGYTFGRLEEIKL